MKVNISSFCIQTPRDKDLIMRSRSCMPRTVGKTVDDNWT